MTMVMTLSSDVESEVQVEWLEGMTMLQTADTAVSGILLVNHHLQIVAASENVLNWLGYRWPVLHKMNITAVFPKLAGRAVHLQQLMNSPQTTLTVDKVRQMGQDGRPVPTFDIRFEMEMGYMRVVLTRVAVPEEVVTQKQLSHSPLGFSKMSAFFNSTVAAFAARAEQAHQAEHRTDALPLAV
jgi:hypothetical protein